jgi:anti-sigma-K factor RskA
MSTRIDPAEYALGLLTPDQEREARRLEREDPGFAAELRALRGVEARLTQLGTDEWDAAGPPPLRLDAITASPGAPAAAPLRERESLWSRLARPFREGSFGIRPGLALAASVLLVGLGVIGGLVLGGDDQPATGGDVVALVRFGVGPAGASGSARVADIGGTREVTLDTSGLKPSAPGTTYEVWMIRDKQRMVSLGTFKVGDGGKATVTLPVTVNPADYPVMDVSIEPVGGPPQHSGKSVLRSPGTPA